MKLLNENIILEKTILDWSTKEDTNINHGNILNEDTILAGKEAKEITKIANNLSEFTVRVLKDGIISLENELKSKDAIIEYLTKQLMSSNSKKPQMKNDKCYLNETFNGDKSFFDNKSSDESNMDKHKTIELKERVVITGDYMQNGVHEKGMTQSYIVKVNNFPGGISATILKSIDQ